MSPSLNSILIIRILLSVVGIIIVMDSLVLFSLLKFNFGTVVPFLIALIFLIHAIYWHAIQVFIEQSYYLTMAWKGCWLVFGLWLMSFLIFIGILLKQIYTQPVVNNKIEAIMVLGSGVNGDQPTPTLANRLDTASDLWKKNPNSQMITTGGIGVMRRNSEASVMANYLTKSHHVPVQKILTEERSTSTEENLQFSKPLLARHGIDVTNDFIVIVTSDFHTIRAKAIAKQQGYANISTLASKTPLSIRANAWFREYFAFISGWLFGEYRLS